MNAKTNKQKKQNVTKWTTIRVREAAKSAALARLKEANTKSLGRKLYLDEVIHFALEKLTKEDLKVLQEKSLSNFDRQEILRQKYEEIHGPITSEEFVGFMLTSKFSDFLKEQVGPSIVA